MKLTVNIQSGRRQGRNQRKGIANYHHHSSRRHLGFSSPFSIFFLSAFSLCNITILGTLYCTVLVVLMERNNVLPAYHALYMLDSRGYSTTSTVSYWSMVLLKIPIITPCLPCKCNVPAHIAPACELKLSTHQCLSIKEL